MGDPGLFLLYSLILPLCFCSLDVALMLFGSGGKGNGEGPIKQPWSNGARRRFTSSVRRSVNAGGSEGHSGPLTRWSHILRESSLLGLAGHQQGQWERGPTWCSRRKWDKLGEKSQTVVVWAIRREPGSLDPGEKEVNTVRRGGADGSSKG